MSAKLSTRLDSPSAANNSFTACFSLQAEAEASVLPRVLALFAKRGLVPHRVHSQLQESGKGNQELHLDLQLEGLDREDVRYYAELMRNIVPVDKVLTFEKHLSDLR
ncbi:MAG: hypothetical protein OQK35_04700 [Alphaproteobacteria bacterium]|nr:hypothetical protein [Alphaproteobacteria bacterium]